MRTLTYYIATSIDGFIAGPGGSIEGILMEGPHADAFVQDMANYDTVLMGGATYALGFEYGLKPGQPAYAGLKHIVLSSSLDFPSNDHVELVPEHAVDRVRRLKEEPGRPIWLCGGGKLAGSLLKAGLIDEIKVKVNPITLGKGISLFEGVSMLNHWMLVDSHAYDNGVVLLHYRR